MTSVGLVLPIFNRPVYLVTALDNIKLTEIPDDHEVTLIMIDDCSTEPIIPEIIWDFDFPRMRIIKIMNTKNKKPWGTLREGFDTLCAGNYDILMNLDADVLLKPYWIKKIIELHNQFPDTVVSGFNTITNHPVLENKGHYAIKQHIGGINMCFNKTIYHDSVRLALSADSGWDWTVCSNLRRDNKYPLVTIPSVIEHIGSDSTLGWAPPGDRACDWVNE